MGGSGPNGEGIPPHVVLTDDLLDRYFERVPYWNEQMKNAAMSALNEVAPDIFEAGIRVGKAARGKSGEECDAQREAGTGRSEREEASDGETEGNAG